MATFIERWKQKTRQLKLDVYAIYLAYRDPRVPWYAKIFVACVVGYAFSPIDLIPDPIPILGYLDDLVLLPIGIWLAVRLIPRSVWKDCQDLAAGQTTYLPHNYRAALVVMIIWAIAIAGFMFWLWQFVNGVTGTW